MSLGLTQEQKEKLTPEEKKMFIKGLEQAKLHIVKVREIMGDTTDDNLDVIEGAIDEDIRWHEENGK